jgi:iron complex outermembrane receptor protein
VPQGVLPFGALGSFPFDWASGFVAFKNAFSTALFGVPVCAAVPVPPCIPNANIEFLLLNGAGPLPRLVRDAQFFTPVPAAEFARGERASDSRMFDLGSGELEIWSIDGGLEWNLEGLPLFGDVDFFALAGYSHIENEGLSDSDATSYGALDTESSQLPETKRTFELRFQSNNESWLNWTLGFFYVNNKIDQSRNTLTPLTVSGATLTQQDKGYAPFANVVLKPIDPIEIFLGVRWNHDEFSRNEDPNPTPFDPVALPLLGLENTFRETTLDASVKWFISENHMVYVKWARGYKAGFTQVLPASSFGGTLFPARQNVVQPETNIATEIGAKTSWFDGRVNANFSAFHYDYSNLQVPVIQFTQILNINAEKATIWGWDATFDVNVVENWTNRVAIGWLSAQFDKACANDPLVNLTLTPPPPDPACAARQAGLNPQDRNLVGDQDLAGKTLEDAPEWKISLLSTYRWDLGNAGVITPTLEFTWTDDTWRRPFNNPDADIVDAYTKTDLRVRWSDAEQRYWVEAFGENLENNYVYPRGIVVALTGTAQGFGLLQPRTYGVRMGFNWGK